MIDLSRFQNLNIKLWHTYTFQAVAIALHFANIASPIVPTEYKVYVTIFIAVLQKLQAELAQLHNVDGTPQSLPGPAVPQLTAPPKDAD